MVTNFQIFERKQVGNIYHFTTIHGIENILKENKMTSDEKWISFTRSKHPYNIYGRENSKVRIKFDCDKMSDNYKFEPYDFSPNDKNQYDEMEERLLLRNKINHFTWELNNIKKYIIKIDIINTEQSYKTYIEEKQKYPEIEINLVEKW